MLAPYLEFLQPGAVVLICPQGAASSDAAHTVFTDQAALATLAGELGLRVEQQYSFPLPRFTGKVFTYNGS